MKISRADTKIFVILLAIIAVLSLYLLLRGGDRVQYELPRLAEIEASEIDTVELASVNGVVRLKRSGQDWIIEPGGHRADPATGDKIVRELAALRITDLVSNTQAGGTRYGLDESSRVIVRGLGEGNLLREILIGSRAPTYHHTYVALPAHRGVYYAEGRLATVFGRGGEELRDRLIFSVRESQITSISVERPEGSFVLKPHADGGWETGGTVMEGEALKAGIDRLANLRCMRYTDASPSAEPLLTLVIEADEPFRLSVFPKDGAAYPAVSSTSGDPFHIASPVGDTLLAAFALPDSDG